MEEREYISLWKCPNCDSKNFDLTRRTCPECDYKFLDIYWNNLDTNWTNTKLFETFEENNKDNFEKYSFQKWNFRIYSIKISNGKINNIKFKFSSYWKEYSFLIGIDYDLKIEEITENNFYETDPEEREKKYKILKIKNLKIYEIFEKAKVGYKEKKYSPNYFNYLWLNKRNLSSFIYSFLEHFHK